MSHADATNDDRQVTLPLRIAYGIGSIADGAKNAAFNGFLVLYYTTVLGLPGTLSGLAIFIALCVDAITDPLVGSISDHFRSRWGRRHPFMYFAAIPMGLCFYGLFSPPDGLSEQQLFVWLTGFAIGVRLFLTFYMVPSGALGPEMTTHYDERTRLVAYRWLIGWAGALAIASAGWFVFFADREVVGDGRLDPANYSQLGIFAGVLVASAILISSAGTHSVIPRLRQPAADGPVFSFGGFARDAAAALKSHTLRMLLGSSLFSAAALGVAEVLGTYMNTWFWEFPSSNLGYLAAFQIIPLLIGFAMVGPVSRRWDKRKAAIGLALFAILWGPLPVLFRFAGIAPENGSPMLLAFIMGHGTFLIAAAIQIGILNSSMVMDATDEHEYESGQRREGTFIAVTTFTAKAVSGFGNFLGGVILDLIDFPVGQVDAAVGNVPEETIFRLGLIAGPGLVAFYLCSLWFITRMRLSRERYAEISHAIRGPGSSPPPEA
ncbi:MAG: MFS transporter [Deltaproteobacteria bacterium]|nr:MFS transporter [Deltaproteobacteria bacterium]